MGVMPALGGALGEQGVRDVSAYVLTQLDARPLPEGIDADPVAGQKTFTTLCAACHGPEGKGMPLLGAPDLTHPRAFIYGSGYAQLQQTIRDGRQGQMPDAARHCLGNDRVHILAAYVYSLSRQDKPAEPR